MNLETWLLFSGAALIVILIPGPLSLLMISNSLNYGLRRSYPAFLGGVFASICLLSASALGLGALLLASEQLFSALKMVGALYLFYLAWQSWQQSRQPARGAVVPQAVATPRFRALFGRAFVLGASNPKDILFFAAFLPQFLSSDRPFLPQLLVMIATWTVLDLLCKLAYGLGAHGAARYLRSGNGQSWFNRTSAGLFGAAGVASLINR
ncbi:threonine/homoserine/homoserine lactone efflux protein [Pseudomonas marginalis]|jgi:threonine/homoserine/homoserine lactone efflux protein|uniref:LysE family translocator n=1 Tax=Pseudomonas TaxID=286 RepID=UPI0020A11240|nr:MULTISPECIES: LysE family translocator [Pseudomonas]MCP1507953.1 threonine/homoserine/homoserine lactone efflux protein [Pseudomonas marginalis]MCP1525457.1 threonine/homoserine/homoserine lactone efflux protein [Pseudomonas marginalis]MDQ0499229.1 threonine/homoserine/homoserine lactone efflux protein [Pseudomonas marginalis]